MLTDAMTDAPQELCRRRNAYRPDLADQRLEGQVQAARFVAGTLKQVRAPAVPMRPIRTFNAT